MCCTYFPSRSVQNISTTTKKGEPIGSPIALYMESSGFDNLLFSGQDHGEQLLARRSVTTALAISTETEEMTAHDILYILLYDSFVFRVIDQFA